MLKLALYQPEIASNLGAAIRIAACFGVELHVVEPCGFPWRDKDIGRVAMDYETKIVRHRDWATFQSVVPGRRVLLTTKAASSIDTLTFAPDDVLILGRESSGVPAAVHEVADERITVPLAPGARSLNVAVAGAIALAEAARQFRGR